MKKKLLIVEDETDLLDLLEEEARKHEIDCEVDSTGESCLQKARCYKPDLILMDMNLPYRNGLELIQELKKSPELAAIPVYLYTSHENDEIIEKALHSGAQGCMKKTGNFDHLFQTLESLLK